MKTRKHFKNTLLLAIAALTLAPLSACASSGTLTTQHRVKGFSTKTHRLTLRAGTTATIIIDGNNKTDLDLNLFDENGRLVDFDWRSGDYGTVRVNPLWKGRFYLKVLNLGQATN